MSSVVREGVRIRYEVDGRGAPLVLQHGFAYCLEDWYETGYAALREDHTLILIDARGHGASDKPHEHDTYSLESQARDVLAVLDTLGIDRAHYFGYSLGGRVGYALAHIAPGRIASLITCGASTRRADPRAVQEWLRIFAGGMPAFLEWWQRVDSIPASIQRRVLANDAIALRALLTSLAQEPELDRRFFKLETPCLLLAGERDAECVGVRAAAGLMSNAKFVALPALTHGESFFVSNAVLPHIQAFLANCVARI